MTPFSAYLFCHLWDVVDEGIDAVLDRAQGQAGVQGISVATACGPIDQLRSHPTGEPGTPRRFISQGGAQFQPDPGRYAATRIRPVPADWLRKRNPLRQLAEACAARRLGLRAVHTCCSSAPTVERYAHVCARDVFGQPLAPWLCPVNPDVREWLRGCVEDLARNYSFDTIELDQCCFPADDPLSTRQTGVPLGPTGAYLSNLCFCESCLQMAARDGVDAAAAASVAAHTLEGILTGAPPTDLQPAAFVATQLPLAAFVDWRHRQITSLYEALRKSCPCRLVLRCPEDPWGAGCDIPALAPHVDALLLSWREPNPAQLPAALAPLVNILADPARVELELSACTPPTREASTLVAVTKQAVDLGIRRITIGNYGLLPLARLEWIRQACRYAQREAQ